MTIYKLLKLLSSESKAKMIVHLIKCDCGDVSVTDICHFTGLKQANVSKHIMTLREENVLDAKKQGREVIYTMNQDFKDKWGCTILSIMSNDKTFENLKCDHIHEGRNHEA